MEDETVVGKDVLKAVGSETRVSILKALQKRQKTQSELASELGLSAPTVLEHMQQLEAAKLIEPVPEYAERKWKYYRLTKLGQGMVEGKRMSVVVMLCYASAIVIGCLMVLVLVLPAFSPQQPISSGGSCGAGSACIVGAMRSLCSTTRTFVSFLAMLILLSGLALLLASYLLARWKNRLSAHLDSISLIGKIVVAIGLFGILAYILIPPLLTFLMGGQPVGC